MLHFAQVGHRLSCENNQVRRMDINFIFRIRICGVQYFSIRQSIGRIPVFCKVYHIVAKVVFFCF
jgi:hypothetical protein